MAQLPRIQTEIVLVLIQIATLDPEESERKHDPGDRIDRIRWAITPGTRILTPGTDLYWSSKTVRDGLLSSEPTGIADNR